MQVLRCQECEPSFFACRVGPSGRARAREQTAVTLEGVHAQSGSCRRAREREETAARCPDLAGGHGREKRPLQGVQILQEGTLEGVQILQEGTGVRKIAQLQLQRMQVLRCQEFEPSFFAERQGLEVQTDRPRSKLIHKQIDRQPSTAFARTIFKYWLPLHPAPHRRTPLAPWRAYPRRPLPRLCTHTHVRTHMKRT